MTDTLQKYQAALAALVQARKAFEEAAKKAQEALDALNQELTAG